MDGFFKGFESDSSAQRAEILIIPMQKEERWSFYKQKLDLIKNVSAIFAVSDYYTIDLICFLNENGISVPNDISVAGFDDIPLCKMLCPTLTTVKQDGELRAKIAIQKLGELKEKKDIETEIVLPVSLVIRNSTKKYDS